MSEEQGWAVVATFAQVYEAEIAKAMLESAGIPAHVLGEHIGVFGPGWSGMAIRGVRLVVPASFVEDARDVLSDDAYIDEQWDGEEDEEVEDDADGDEPDDEPRLPEEPWRSWGEWGPGAG